MNIYKTYLKSKQKLKQNQRNFRYFFSIYKKYWWFWSILPRQFQDLDLGQNRIDPNYLFKGNLREKLWRIDSTCTVFQLFFNDENWSFLIFPENIYPMLNIIKLWLTDLYFRPSLLYPLLNFLLQVDIVPLLVLQKYLILILQETV